MKQESDPGFGRTVIAAVMIAGSLSAGSALSAPRAELAKIQKQMLDPAVQIGDFCSGSIIKSERDAKSGKVQTIVLTAKHCVDDDTLVAVNIPVYDPEGRVVQTRSYQSKVKGTDWQSDTALLKLTDEQTYFETVVKFAPKGVTLIRGEDVWAVGYPHGRVQTLTQGEYGALEYNQALGGKEDSEFFRFTPGVVGGNSGGPVFHQNEAGEYEVIGLVTGGNREAGFMNSGTPLAAILAYVEMLLKPAAPVSAKASGE